MMRSRLATRGVAGVSFDAHRTLIHSPRLVEIYSEVLRRHGLVLLETDLERLIPRVWQELSCLAGPGRDRFASHPEGARGFWRRFLERICEHLEAPTPSPFAAAELFDRFARPGSWEVFPDVRPTLERLKRCGLELAVISNWDVRLPPLLEGLGLGLFFRSIVCSSDVGAEKPYPRIFQRALRDLGLPPERVVHVGDSALEDWEGATAAGLNALVLDRSGAGLGDLESLEELPGWLGLSSGD